MSANEPIVSIEAEQAVIGAVLMDGFSFPRVTLSDGDFFHPRHQWIWQAFSTLHKLGEPIDIITVSDVLKANGKLKDAGGDAYLSTLLGATDTTAHISAYATIVKKMSIRRGLLKVAEDIKRAVLDDTESDIMDIYHESVKALQGVELINPRVSTKKRIVEFIKEREELWNNPTKENGLSWGFPAFDRAFGLVKRQTFWLVVGQAKGGKSLLMAHAMRNWLRMGKRVLLLSLEMTDFEILERLEAIETGINFDEARVSARNEKAWQELNRAWGEIYEYNLVIDDTPATMDSIKTKLMQAERELGGKVDILILDYAGLVTPADSEKRSAFWERMNEIAIGLKRLTKSEDIIVVSAGQLNRKGFGYDTPTMDEVGGTVGNVQNPNAILAIYPTDETNPNLFAIHHMANRSHEAGQTLEMIRVGLRIGLRHKEG